MNKLILYFIINFAIVCLAWIGITILFDINIVVAIIIDVIFLLLMMFGIYELRKIDSTTL